MPPSEFCTNCERPEPACICGRKSAYWCCAHCHEDVGKQTAIWVSADGADWPIHEDCLVAFLRENSGSVVSKKAVVPSGPRTPVLATPAAAVEADEKEIASVIELPMRIITKGTRETLALNTQVQLVEVFQAFLYAAQEATYTYSPETNNVRIEGFNEKLRVLLGNSEQARPM